MGITPGYGDDYTPFVGGQQIDITDLPAGDYYVLVHIADPNAVLAESEGANNASSLPLRLSRPGGPDGPPQITAT